jgi:Methyltransferase FkbM domain
MNALGPQIITPGGTVPTELQETVRLETIDALVERCGLDRLDLVKLDIEGSEIDALEGATTAMARFHPTILPEAEDARLASQGRDKDDLRQAVAAIGYELWVLPSAARFPVKPCREIH